MADVTIKLFGVLRVDTHLACEQVNAERLGDIFALLNKRVDEVYAENKKLHPSLEHPPALSFKDAIVYINGERCSKKNRKLNDGEEIWLLSPASGG
ncbi:MAG: MoaD/ThiS family protein [Lachnospiraceae bacterium]|nr:MoaD/ThiS family protein [Lachnospiraceae bacterium]